MHLLAASIGGCKVSTGTVVTKVEAIVASQLDESANLKHELKGMASNILGLAEDMYTCLKTAGKVFLCGNGGSAADAQHIAAELVGMFLKDRRALPGIALT